MGDRISHLKITAQSGFHSYSSNSGHALIILFVQKGRNGVIELPVAVAGFSVDFR